MKLIQSECISGNSHRFTFESEYKEKQKFLITSDWHFDNPKCDRELLFSHLDKAVEDNAKIIVTGDLLCLMQGKYDKRSNKSDIRPEHNRFDYLDAVIGDTADKLSKYANNILLISRGNHETSVSGRCETDVLNRLVERINALNKSNIQVGNYTGFYQIKIKYKNGSDNHSFISGYSHGNWGGVITKGTLSVVRMAAIMPDADAVFSGHTHDGWIVPQPRLIRSRDTGLVETKNQWHVKTGTYKKEFKDGIGWAVERIGMPKYIGSCWMELEYIQQKGITPSFTLTT